MTATPAPLTVLDYAAMGIGYAVMMIAFLLAVVLGVSRATRRAKGRGR